MLLVVHHHSRGIAACVAAADLHLDGTVSLRQNDLQQVINTLMTNLMKPKS